MAIYFTTSLETIDLPDLAEDPYRLPPDGPVYYRLTPSTYAWVLSRVYKARQATLAGRMAPDTLSTIESRLDALQKQQKAYESAGGAPFPDELPEPPARLPAAPRWYTDEELDAITEAIADEATDSPCAMVCLELLRWPGIPKVGARVIKK